MKKLIMTPTTSIEFAGLSIHDHFFHHGTFWRKTTHTAARDLKGFQGYGNCSFVEDEEDKVVTKVEISFEDQPNEAIMDIVKGELQRLTTLLESNRIFYQHAFIDDDGRSPAEREEMRLNIEHIEGKINKIKEAM